MLILDEEDDWASGEKENIKIGIGFIWQDAQASELNNTLKFKAIEIPTWFSNDKRLTFEPVYHLNKIDKQLQYFNKVTLVISAFLQI